MSPISVIITIAAYFAILFTISYIAGRKADNEGCLLYTSRGAVAQVGKDTSPLSINPELEPTELRGGGYKYGFTGPSSKLKPEMTTSYEIGAEGRFLNDRIVADFTYFRTRCTDQIVRGFRLSYATGFVLNTRNLGDFKTWGWEGHIDGDIIHNYNGWRWNVGVNLSHTGSKTISLPMEMCIRDRLWHKQIIL